MDCRVKPGNDEFSAIFGNDAFHNECVARAQLRMVPSAVRTRSAVMGYSAPRARKGSAHPFRGHGILAQP